MLGNRRLISILGLSKGGTNHLAQCVHACQDVVGLTESASRLMHPTRDDHRQILTPEAVQAGVLKPTKPFGQVGIVSVNKINYTLVAYPEAWAQFLANDDNSSTVVLLRNPMMVHRSRTRYVNTTKPQRTAWLNAHKLAREILELLAMTWRLPNAVIAFHEHGLTDHYRDLLVNRLGLDPSAAVQPDRCQTCGTALDQRRRSRDDPSAWLFCPTCERFIEGEGSYNYLRKEDDLNAYRAQEADARSDDLIKILRDAVGDTPTDLFLDGAHWSNDGPDALRTALDGDADRWRSVPLNEILYPY